VKLTKRPDGYWITDVPPGVEEMGPYATQAEAEDDRRGVQRTLDELEEDRRKGGGI
jgi:hypothetical protein